MKLVLRTAAASFMAGSMIGWACVLALVSADHDGLGKLIMSADQGWLALAMLLGAVGSAFGIGCMATALSSPRGRATTSRIV
jgi:hypothetical protein